MSHLDPEARKILSLARAARTPSAADKQRVRRQLAAAAAASVAAAAGADVAHATQGTGAGLLRSHNLQAAQGAGAVKQGVGLAGALKLYVGGVLLVVSVAAGFVLLDQQAPAPQSTATDMALAASSIADARAHSAAPAADARVSGVEPTRFEVPISALQPGAAPRRTLDQRPGDGMAAAVPRPTPPPPPAAAQRTPDGSLSRELDLLHGAQTAWRERDSQKTLSLLDQHARKYPKSALRYERGALRVLALCELGRLPEAHRLGQALIRRAPSSPVRTTIEDSCAFK